MRAMVLGALVCALALVLVPIGAYADTTLEIYGNADVSVDGVNRGVKDNVTNQSLGGACTTNNAAFGCDSKTTPPVSNGTGISSRNSYTQISSNLSYLGFRVNHDLANGMKVLVQIETQVDVTATPSVKDSLGSRDTYLGLAGSLGAIKIGKSFTPYSRSTASFDPFSATIGDYNDIMGNTGGDNRSEFDGRLPHSIWYETPNLGGFSWQFLASPGQNIGTDDSNFPTGEALCSGSSPGGSGTAADFNSPDHPGVSGPGAGGFKGQCVDGAFGDAYSTAFNYQAGGLLMIAAYELHVGVNRHTDDVIDTNGNTVVQSGVHDETAGKVGASYDTGSTKVAAVYENFQRNGMPSIINERTRDGYYATLSQKLGDTYSLSLANAHANKTPGDPSLGKSVDNQADMYAVGIRKSVEKNFQWYLVWAEMANHSGAHYGLGQGGHGIPILGRTASDNGPNPVNDAGVPVSFGNTIQAVSIGLKYSFTGSFLLKE